MASKSSEWVRCSVVFSLKGSRALKEQFTPTSKHVILFLTLYFYSLTLVLGLTYLAYCLRLELLWHPAWGAPPKYSTVVATNAIIKMPNATTSSIVASEDACKPVITIQVANFPRSYEEVAVIGTEASGPSSSVKSPPWRELQPPVWSEETAARGETEVFLQCFLILQLGNGTVTAWSSPSKDYSFSHTTFFRSSLHKQHHLGPIRWGEEVCLPLGF